MVSNLFSFSFFFIKENSGEAHFRAECVGLSMEHTWEEKRIIAVSSIKWKGSLKLTHPNSHDLVGTDVPCSILVDMFDKLHEGSHRNKHAPRTC